MRWSWRILNLAGIGIYVHATFLLLPLWIGLTQFLVRHSWADAWTAVGFVLLLFFIVVLHELGHAATARRFGIRTRDITLLPIGGVARLERIPQKPKQELLVALAGPAVNVSLAALLFAIIGAGRQVAGGAEPGLPGNDFLSSLMWVNLLLAGFNLVPAFPMDGGRVLRALLATRISYVRATQVAAAVGRIIALLFGLVGLASLLSGGVGPFSNPFLLLIALLVWIGAGQEAGLVQMQSALAGLPVSRLMITEFRRLEPQEPLGHAVECLMAGWQEDFPVVEGDRVAGLLTRSALVDGLAQRGASALVGDAMLREFATIEEEAGAETALLRLRLGDRRTLLVMRDGMLRGILTRDHLAAYLLIQNALENAGAGRRTVLERPENS